MAGHDANERILEAAEYVLGTLDERQRARFETRLVHDAGARRERDYWEQRLGSLGLALAPVAPPESVWRAVARRAGITAGTDGARERGAGASPHIDTQQAAANDSVGIWRGIALVASVAALVMAGLLFTGSTTRIDGTAAPTQPVLAYASVVHDEPTGTSWLVTAHAGSAKMKVQAMGDYDVPEGKVLRAWLKPKDGEPMLLGRWPSKHGEHEMVIPDRVAQSMDKPAELMVSMEDAGAATAQAEPRGKMMWTAPIARRTG